MKTLIHSADGSQVRERSHRRETLKRPREEILVDRKNLLMEDDKAIYAYPAEHYEYWRQELPDLTFSWGSLGKT